MLDPAAPAARRAERDRYSEMREELRQFLAAWERWRALADPADVEREMQRLGECLLYGRMP
ncbi:hypothetical protein GCM10010964_43460 [Caldovatus sediminis]|uniref:Uncharacterized protein n=1 Tax=Caldovatus sediminis TaxID=2041189 RepID=A0A8J2ZF26_9PROT|nr:hypothetical protein [Caldovatus sediminis]GGG51572.1 hypothetical protein GCM10010964_43460 [Caldovatus sediminis]